MSFSIDLSYQIHMQLFLLLINYHINYQQKKKRITNLCKLENKMMTKMSSLQIHLHLVSKLGLSSTAWWLSRSSL